MESPIIKEKQIVGYLLGELSESEQLILEESFISNPQIFTQVVEVENDLIDDYIRGQLTPGERDRFEQYFLTNPSRRQRVQIAEALLPLLAQAVTPYGSVISPGKNLVWWRRLLAPIGNLQLAPRFIAALVLFLITLSGAWLIKETRRLAQEIRITRTESERRERELTQQIADEKRLNSELAGEIERLRTLSVPQVTPLPSSTATAYSTLILLGGTLRDTNRGPAPRLLISPGVEQVRLVVKMENGGYRDYRAELQSESGETIWSRGGLKPRLTPSVATFTITLPASMFTGGSYTLTVSGVSDNGNADILSSSSFPVEFSRITLPIEKK
jgi:hypothetical protein